jgi:hypothetical protein
MIKKILTVFSLALAITAFPAKAALLATWDIAAGLSGSTTSNGITVNISGGGSGGIATLDSNGTFSLFGLDNISLDLDAAGILGGGILDLAASGSVVGTYISGSQQLSGNTATLNVSQNSPCDPYGFLGGSVCSAVPGVIDFNVPFVLNSAQGLADPITFDLVNDFSFLLGNLGGVAALHLSLSNAQLSPVPVPAAAWLFGSAIASLVSIKRQKCQSV